MGAGKSTYGKKLAGKMGYDFLDLDTMIEEKVGKSVYDIFNSDGEEFFRKTETEVLRSTANLDNVVISTGGGAPAHSENMDWMNENGTTIYLKLFANKIFNRLWKAKVQRPTIEGMDQAELQTFIQDKLPWRAVEYIKADFVINPEGFLPKNLADELKLVDA